MISAFGLAVKVIKAHKKDKEYLLNMVDVYRAANRLTDDEYTQLVELINTEYPDEDITTTEEAVG